MSLCTRQRYEIKGINPIQKNGEGKKRDGEQKTHTLSNKNDKILTNLLPDFQSGDIFINCIMQCADRSIPQFDDAKANFYFSNRRKSSIIYGLKSMWS